MSYKAGFQSNNIDLQSLIDLANNLPSAGTTENLDDELATQDDLIAQIIAGLEGKAAGDSGGNSVTMCSVTFVNNSDDSITLYPKYEGYSGSVNVDRFESATIEVPKNSAVWFTGWVPLGGSASPTTAGSVTIGSSTYEGMAAIYTDGTITIRND